MASVGIPEVRRVAVFDAAPDQHSIPVAGSEARWLQRARVGVVAHFDLVGLAGIWVLSAILVRPVGDFPLNDDWAYGLPVKALVETGSLRFTDWQSMPLLAQVLWGALFALPGGFSFTALRISTLVLGGVGGVGLVLLLRQLGARRAVALLGGAALLSSPIYLTLAHSFMTDVPFLALSIFSVLFFLRGADEGGGRSLMLGVALAVAATLIRQIGLGIPLAFGVALLLRGPLTRSVFLRAVWPTTVVLLALVSFNQWMQVAGLVPSLYDSKSSAVAAAASDLLSGRLGVLRNVAERSVWLFLYGGLMAAPLAIPLLFGALRTVRRGVGLLWGLPALALVAAAGAAAMGLTFPAPLVGNVLLGSGVGPRTIAGYAESSPSSGLLLVTTAVALLGGGAVLFLTSRAAGSAWRMLRGRRRLTHEHRQFIFFLMLVAACFLPIGLAYGAVFDRYYVFFVPWLLALALAGAGRGDNDHQAAPGGAGSSTSAFVARTVLSTGFALAGVSLSWSTAAAHDYLAQHRVQWQAGEWLVAQGISPERIEGGFEWNNYHALTLGDQWQGSGSALVDPSGREYAIVATASEHQEVLRSFQVPSWLGDAPHALFAVRHLGSAAGPGPVARQR